MTEMTASPAIAGMLRAYSIEVSPTHPKMVDAALERLERGTEVFLPWIPGTNPGDALQPLSLIHI